MKDVYNINVGVLGHVDSGKTSLVAALSDVLSVAALDKHPQSQERGITLDIGLSAFTVRCLLPCCGCSIMSLHSVCCRELNLTSHYDTNSACGFSRLALCSSYRPFLCETPQHDCLHLTTVLDSFGSL